VFSILTKEHPLTGDVVDAVHWPKYTLDNPRNFYFTANQTSYVEQDYYRAEAVAYLAGIVNSQR
jgi:triacylglycerol lipase